ncbi:hypothetical protein COCMIDRAFT_4794 [Bipolaris oryzae ATCC 44560]|uniref:Uncharacterized protein n=1 Tax=Bipolaris oryzae ATCC 44560 TaxID=930090 RepID=W6ZEV7_COCMI|nr:uncharacterized protein COCMIDRAFT_4794 [Bipolaris oryzae ATCC 44560]EUC46049.1 hypothetical protein COCMIDRAFT_4794 [Bipolaris oryzae ATCC 44560]
MNLLKSASPVHTHTLEERSAPASEAAYASPIHGQDVSDSASELEASHISDASQPAAPTASKQPTPDDHEEEHDPHFTGDLMENQRREVKSHTFDSQDENMRAQNSLLPESFYRTFYETSATLSRYVTVNTHVKHRKRKDLKMDDHNAFQAVAVFSLDQNMFLEEIERHLVWNQKKIPSAYISVFNGIGHAERQANFHYERSQRIGQRVSIAKMHTKGLVPATIRAECETTVKVFTKSLVLGESVKIKKYSRHVDIPVWIHQKAMDRYYRTITPEQLKKSGADMWISITELRKSNLKVAEPKFNKSRDVICAQGHDYEWLCCGGILESRVTGVWPWDGKQSHMIDPGYPVRSVEHSGQPWVWDWNKKMWLPDLFSASAAQGECFNTKRQRTNHEPADDKNKKTAVCECSKARPLLSMSNIQSDDSEPIYPGPTTKL